MRDNVLYARLAHYAFARMLPLAEKIGEEGLTLHETGLPWLINYGEYTRSSQQLLEQLADMQSHLWRSRLVLMWDYLSSCREMATSHCRAIINQVTARLQDWMQHPDAIHIEWVRRMHKEQMATFRQQLDQARWLFEQNDLSSHDFATALRALAQVAMYVLSTEEKAPWQREIQIYEDLYSVFLTEVPELENPEDIPG